jgi:hypothetical protein
MVLIARVGSAASEVAARCASGSIGRWSTPLPMGCGTTNSQVTTNECELRQLQAWLAGPTEDEIVGATLDAWDEDKIEELIIELIPENSE